MSLFEVLNRRRAAPGKPGVATVLPGRPVVPSNPLAGLDRGLRQALAFHATSPGAQPLPPDTQNVSGPLPGAAPAMESTAMAPAPGSPARPPQAVLDRYAQRFGQQDALAAYQRRQGRGRADAGLNLKERSQSGQNPLGDAEVAFLRRRGLLR